MLPQINLVGNVTRDPVLAYTSSGTPYTTFGIACNEKYGQNEQVCFIDCTVFGKSAEAFAQYIVKGKSVQLVGKLQLDQWEDNQGQKRSKHKMIVNQWGFVGPKTDDGERQSRAEQPAATDDFDFGGASDEIPF